MWADSGCRGAQTRVDREDLQWHIAARPSDIAKLPDVRHKEAAQKREHRKARVRAKVEHPFRVIKRQFGLAKVRFRGLAKNTAHVVTLFALSNLWMARRQLMAMALFVREAHERRAARRRPLETSPLESKLLGAAVERAKRARVFTLFRPSLVAMPATSWIWPRGTGVIPHRVGSV